MIGDNLFSCIWNWTLLDIQIAEILFKHVVNREKRNNRKEDIIMSTNTFIMEPPRPQKGISGSTLKLIAIVTMFIDHIGAAVLEDSMLFTYFFQHSERSYIMISTIDLVLRLIGRIAFPIFCFLLVEGFVHTRDVKKYAIRLGLFCFLSEIPFDLAFFKEPFFLGHQNVFFTLFIGLLVLIGLKKFEGTGIKNGVGRVLCVVVGAGLARILRTDYDAFGVFVIVLFYLFRNRPILRDITTMLILLICSPLEITGVIALLPIHLYNGQRGRQAKYLFYLFYPVHLFILYCIGRLLIHMLFQ